jgi:hypothetical protein
VPSSQFPREEGTAHLPLELREELHASSKVISIGPQGERTLYALWGTSKLGEPMFALVYDLPVLVVAPRTKLKKEMDDVRIFLAQSSGRDDFEIGPGPHPNEPPDVFAEVAGHKVGIETTQLLMPSAAAAKNLTSISRAKVFEQLRDHLLSRSAQLKGALRQHRGRVLYIWFASPDSVARGMPPRQSALETVIQFLKDSYPPDRIPQGPSPKVAPKNSVAWSGDRQIGVTWADLPRGYVSTTTKMLGFEIGLSYNAEVSRGDVRNELRRLLEQHDHPTSEVVLVTLNGSLASGLYFPSSHLVSRLLFEDPDPLSGWVPRHVTRVVIHDPADPESIDGLWGPRLGKASSGPCCFRHRR